MRRWLAGPCPGRPLLGRARLGLLLLAGLLLGLGQGGCFSIVKEERVQRFQIKTRPSGAAIYTQEAEGEVLPRGQAPVVVEQRYTASLRRYRLWHWVWPVLAAAGTATGLGLMTTKEHEGTGAGLGTLSGLFLVVSTISSAIFTVDSGRVIATTPAALTVLTQLPGSQRREHRIDLVRQAPRSGARDPGPASIELDIHETPTSRPARPPLPPGTRLALFEMASADDGIAPAELTRLGLLFGQRLQRRGLRVLPPEQLRPWLASPDGGRLRCFPGTCQLEVARAAGAEMVVETRAYRDGGECALVATVTRVSWEMTERRIRATSSCTPAGLQEAVESLATQLGGP